MAPRLPLSFFCSYQINADLMFARKKMKAEASDEGPKANAGRMKVVEVDDEEAEIIRTTKGVIFHRFGGEKGPPFLKSIRNFRWLLGWREGDPTISSPDCDLC